MREKENIIKIGLFILFDALVFHEALASYHPQIKSLNRAPQNNYIPFLRSEWKKIMQVNYIPVFSLAHRILVSFPTSPTTDYILKELIETALKVMGSGVLLKQDLMGRIYHKLLLRAMGHYYATYYTSIPAAWILANLSVKTENPDLDWDYGTVSGIQALRILDPACGSGTLLSAIYTTIKDRYLIERKEDINLSEMHRVLLEESLHGWDILDYATHLTLTTLALHNHRASFSNANIYTLPIGVGRRGREEEIYLGSLDYLPSQQKFIGRGFVLISPIQKGMVEIKREAQFNMLQLESDIIIMNPPFSRSAKPNVKFGYTEEGVKKKLEKRLRDLGRAAGFTGIGQAGLGAYFILLGNNLLKKGGRLSVVVPRAILSGVSWRQIRNKLLEDYEIEYIVSNHDPGDGNEGIEPWNFSENTNLGEVLIVARKTNKPHEERMSTIMNLWNKPKNEIESLIASHQSIRARKQNDLKFFEGGVYKYLRLGAKNIGTVYNLSQTFLSYNFLFPVLFANPYLNKLVFELITNKIPLPLKALGTISQDLGRDIKQVKDTFDQTASSTPYRIVWGHTSSINTIELNPSFIGYGHPKKDSFIYKDAAKFLIAERPHLKTENLVSVFSPREVLATAFWEIKLDEDSSKILALWLNSTFGFLLYLSNSVSSMGEIFKIKKKHLENLLVLDITKLNKGQRSAFLSLYQKIKNQPFKPFPEEFSLASRNKGTRRYIDDLIIKFFGIEQNLRFFYEKLAEEPVLTLGRL